jgi:Trypsin-like peptidase domain
VRAAALLCAPLALAGAAIGDATGGDGVAAPAIVTVGDGHTGVATGFTVSPGRVVTVAHLLAGDAIAVRGGDGVARRGAVLRRDDALDLALLAVPGLRPAPAFGRAGTLMLVRREGAIVAEPARVVRRISARVRAAGAAGIARRPALELAATVTAGDSGAPVLVDGRRAGIVFARSRERAGIAYAVDAAALDRLLR